MPRTKNVLADKHVGARVRLRRMMLDMSQQNVAELLGTSPPQLQKYEAGINKISPSRLQRLAQILEVPVSFFFQDGLDMTIQTSELISDYVQDFLATRDGLELAKAFSRIENRNVRRAIVELVEQIVPE
jgi:transcriptional regulator with XRE-family HTH domain